MNPLFRVKVLCEDRAHQHFFSALLAKRCHLDFSVAPDAQAASAWVLQQYPQTVRSWIRRRPNENKVLIAVVDGDNLGPSKRQRELSEALMQTNEPERSPRERIVHCFPTWSIETWYAASQDEQSVTESQSYKKLFQRERSYAETNRAVEWFLRTPLLPAAAAARAELAERAPMLGI